MNNVPKKFPADLAYLCACCGAIAYADVDSIDSGTTLTCESCDGKTVISLQTVEEYCNEATRRAVRETRDEATDLL